MQKLIKAILCGAAVMSVPAYASLIGSELPSSAVTFEDDSADLWLDVNGNGTLDVGDRLRSVISIPTYFTSSGPVTNFVNELAGIVDLEVLTRSDVAPGIANYTFGPSAAFQAAYGLGAMIALYEDSVHEYARSGSACNTAAGVAPGGTCEQLITDGSLLMLLGFSGDLDEYWRADFAGTNPLLGQTVSPSGNFPGAINFGVSILVNNTGLQWGLLDTSALFDNPGTGDNKVGMIGSGSLQGVQGENTAYHLYDDFQFSMNRVPEPGSLSLLGIGAVGLAALRRRKQA